MGRVTGGVKIYYDVENILPENVLSVDKWWCVPLRPAIFPITGLGIKTNSNLMQQVGFDRSILARTDSGGRQPRPQPPPSTIRDVRIHQLFFVRSRGARKFILLDLYDDNVRHKHVL